MEINKNLRQSTKTLVADRDLGEDGHTCCGYCNHAITTEQGLGLQHIVPISAAKTHTPEQLCDLFGLEGAEREVMKHCDNERAWAIHFNHPDNLVPMHNACHQEADHGIQSSPWQAARVNRRYHDREVSDESEAELLAEKILRQERTVAESTRHARMHTLLASRQLLCEQQRDASASEAEIIGACLEQIDASVAQRHEKAARLNPVQYSKELHQPNRMYDFEANADFLMNATPEKQAEWLSGAWSACKPSKLFSIASHFDIAVVERAVELLHEKLGLLYESYGLPNPIVTGEKTLDGPPKRIVRQEARIELAQQALQRIRNGEGLDTPSAIR